MVRTEKGKEVEDEEKENQEGQRKNEVTKKNVANLLNDANKVGGDVVRNTGPISQLSSGTQKVGPRGMTLYWKQWPSRRKRQSTHG